jgi:putative Mn2+ efflux pump MntP
MAIATSMTLALSLSMDAFAASMSKGATLHRPSVREAARIGAYFGFFEFVAPLFGWALGFAFAGFISAVDHWVAFILLLGVGGRMSWLALRNTPDQDISKPARHTPLVLIAVALGTSVDATAVGITLETLNVDIPMTILLIGVVTFAIAFGGVLVGRVAGPVLGRWAEFFGGLGLIAIGTKVLIDHTLLQ